MPITLTSENFKDLLANIDQFVFWDTVGLFFWRLPAGLCRRLEAIYRRPVIPQRDKRTGAYILLFHQPWPQLLQVLDDVQRQHHATVCRADLAADFVTSWVLIEPLKRFLLTYVILRWRWPGPMHSNARAVIANELRCCSRTSNVSFGSVVCACVGHAVPSSSSQWRQSRKTSADWQSLSSDHRRSPNRALHEGAEFGGSSVRPFPN